ncbi:conserved hypothetical protein [Candidatus Nitrospira nitrosa]|uniref:Uncharacterized protein n=1 Tax=Candidatus Nitrospira nitrosa TaxID=1742972 RepID=A0A0S4LH56_9BACT|nr:hypothetical protein [Candidatus Nitrospira nitrosa]CUS36940.1 conserved hypothetical protein [Candidatus Nitrospira nitrosa]
MAKLQPSDSRITIADTAEGLRIVMPCRRSWFVICFLTFWLWGWVVAEVMVANQLMMGDGPPEGELFMLAWLGVWTVGGVVAIYAWLWQLMGKEILTVRGQTFNIRRDIGGFGFDREYNLVQVRDLRIGSVGPSRLDLSSSFQLWGVGGGVISFDYGGRTARFGASLDEAEAKLVVTAIKQRFHLPDSSLTPKLVRRSPGIAT